MLEKGDVLYIPPMWWHRVQAQGFSLSVNVWSEVRVSIARVAARLRDRARWAQLPGPNVVKKIRYMRFPVLGNFLPVEVRAAAPRGADALTQMSNCRCAHFCATSRRHSFRSPRMRQVSPSDANVGIAGGG